MKQKTLQFDVAITYSHTVEYNLYLCEHNVLTCLNTLHTSGQSFSIHMLQM